MALAPKRKRNNILLFFEGAAAEGEFHEAMNPQHFGKFLFVCENNLYAMERRLDTPIQ
jgi:TPP-dependent pyruvate/acetoin dehydrogenase alpha subunit